MLAATACAGDRATAPPVAFDVAPPLATRDEPHVPEGNAFGRVAKCSHRETFKGAAVIGRRGGTLRVGNDYLIIPAGALDARVKIVGEVQEGSIAAIHLEPQGLRFARPALLELDATGCGLGTTDRPAMLYIDDEDTVLERIDARFDPASARLVAPITHFSVYAVGV